MEDQQGSDEQYASYEDAVYADGQVDTIGSVEWTASEYVAHQKSSGWFAALVVSAVITTGIVIAVTGSITSAVVVLLSFIAFGAFAVRKPATKSYKITSEGVTVDSHFFEFEDFKSFSVMEEGAIDCIWLRPLKRFTPTVAMYFPPEEEDKIIMVLENFLPLEDRVHDLVDRLSQRFRF